VCCGSVLARTPLGGVAADDPSMHLELQPTPAAPREARAFFADHVDGLDEQSAQEAALCVSELITNGVLHARTPLVFGVTVGRDRILVTVADGSGSHPAPVAPDDSRPSGRGMVLVDAIVEQWGVQERDDGKTVWFTIRRGER
jgi:anti-sigma regulatory factor (Ser/Thr protein kinase)